MSDLVSVVCISDTHNSQPELPNGDILIHAGDLTQSGSRAEIQTALDWLQSQPHQHKIVIAGNHDLLLDSQCDEIGHRIRSGPSAERPLLQWGDLIYLQDSSIALALANGRQLKIYGSPRSPKHGSWAFQYPGQDDVWKGMIPDDVDILVTHAPPMGHLDMFGIGCSHLLRSLWSIRPKLHVFGHVHAGYGHEFLRYDPLQAAFEQTVKAKGGLWNLVRVMRGLLWTMLGAQVEPQTQLINASMVGGLWDEVLRTPITVYV
ncbi:hypothetical protein OQA88_9707 [Cercophora sp. LCS_1]